MDVGCREWFGEGTADVFGLGVNAPGLPTPPLEDVIAADDANANAATFGDSSTKAEIAGRGDRPVAAMCIFSIRATKAGRSFGVFGRAGSSLLPGAGTSFSLCAWCK